MDPERFDRLARSLTRPASRRRALGILVGGFGMLVSVSAGAERKHVGNHRHRHGKRGNSACAHFCADVFGADTPEAGACTSDAARGRGLCYLCGPKAQGSNLTLCGQHCVRIGTDDHCHDCNDACAADQRCVAGQCQASGGCQTCGAGNVCCGGTCVSGDCCVDADCGAHAHCDHHACACDSGVHLCAGLCVSDADVAHCGAACSPCPTDPHGTETCDGTSCGLICDAGYHLSGGACVADGSCDCSNLNFCSGNGICNPDCSCTCFSPYTGAACNNEAPFDCTTATTCADCLAHQGDNCIFCSLTLDSAIGVCVTTDNCIVPDTTCVSSTAATGTRAKKRRHRR